jgi:hypothetical protein
MFLVSWEIAGRYEKMTAGLFSAHLAIPLYASVRFADF